MSKLIKVIGPAIGMGFFTGLLWKEINALATTDGVGILARQGWPLHSFWTLVILGAVAESSSIGCLGRGGWPTSATSRR